MTDVRYYDEPACPECGAPQVDGLNCWWQMGAICGWEADDPALQAVHFHTVATFNLQHPAQFLPEVLAGLQALHHDVLTQGLPPKEMRRRMGQPAKVLRPPEQRTPVARAWRMTVADVYAGGRREGAAERVKAWAASLY